MGTPAVLNFALLLALGARLVMVFSFVLLSNFVMAENKADYVGSDACKGCHTYIFGNWKSTRHGSSIMTGAQARDAGYPLPDARRGGETPTIQAWDDVSYVIGRRQRIAYIDRNGVVQDTSYHHRIDKWSPFPSKKMWECGSCHFTAFGSGPIRNNSVAVSGRWVEMNIGCEACHGPGGQHVQSLNKEDITVNASSRLCGGCHTTVGKVLPVDDQQDMHDLVQVWNHDRHITGTQFQSHNAFCARCHSPFQGSFDESAESAKRRVFTEHKHNITCIGCHNPHELTTDHYARPQISLEPPLLPRLHTYQGDDGDFTTTDFDEFETVEKVCVRCHRGADRVDLDHANATCGDCHLTHSIRKSSDAKSSIFPKNIPATCDKCHGDSVLITVGYCT